MLENCIYATRPTRPALPRAKCCDFFRPQASSSSLGEVDDDNGNHNDNGNDDNNEDYASVVDTISEKSNQIFLCQKKFFSDFFFLIFPGNGIASSNRKETLEVEIRLDRRLTRLKTTKRPFFSTCSASVGIK